MKTAAFGDTLFQLTRFGFVNCYLVREDDGFTLIDTGLSGSTQTILAAAKTQNSTNYAYRASLMRMTTMPVRSMPYTPPYLKPKY